MDDKLEEAEIVSTQKRLQPTHDSGWNDPPKWAYSPSSNISSGSTPTKRLLNKRVAFPLNSTCSPATQLSSSTNLSCAPLIQPTPVNHAPLLAPIPDNVIKNSASEIIIDKKQRSNDTFENLDYVIDNMFEKNCQVDEIQKRLELLKTMWEDDKLNDEICNNVYEISKALRSNDIDMADKIHVLLMMNHGALCNSWISVIRHLILTLKEQSNVKNHEDIDNKSELLLHSNDAMSQ